ncbi:putative DNA methylase [Candidatus Saccharibacteria bacterium RAAC3_TM7_1]|nr:putative DNA methylase [Candidatus Saccharibacteria bacterium RAAC3_TM7_1]HCZ28414.1 methyltransferase domain-containing protein [Candidatus Saccharibacteria bacterium]
MILCILGRQPELSLAELEQRFGSDAVLPFSPEVALLTSDDFSIETLGGILKAGQVVAEFPRQNWQSLSNEIVHYYTASFLQRAGKITLGISVYGENVSPKAIQMAGLKLKQATKARDGSLRLVPNDDAILGTATSHHNKLGLSDNKIELLVAYGKNKVVIAESTGAQNITALARRDQGRPKRDAFVGMLPPKLALMMINMAHPSSTSRILDPFCGTGVVLQEAALLGYSVYGTDLSEKMIRYTRDNLNWLQDFRHNSFDWYLHEGDATTTQWQQPIDCVVGETYLGQPFSAPPSPAKLQEVVRNCDHIITSFLKNLHSQLKPGTPLCLAVPAWRDANGRLTQLPLIDNIGNLGYEFQPLQHVDVRHLAYFREDQVVARQLLILKRH